MRHNGGLAAAIKIKAGANWELESKEFIKSYGPIKTGASGVTSAGNLPSKHVIHTVGPIYQDYEPEVSERLLQAAILNTLESAKKVNS